MSKVLEIGVKGELHTLASTPQCGGYSRPDRENAKLRQDDYISRAQDSSFQDCGLRAPFMAPHHSGSMGTNRLLS